MMRQLRGLVMAGAFLGALLATDRATAQKSGGTLKVYFFDSPASMSIHEEATIAGQGPMMGVFNNLVMYKQDVPQSGMSSIVPDLASDWSWDETKTELTFRLRQASSGMTASPSPPRTLSAPGISSPAIPRRSCGSTRARRGIAISTR